MLEKFAVGQTFTETFVLNEHVYRTFQECSNDLNPLHTDEVFAKSKGFRGRVMYGNILNVFLSFFIGECLPIRNVIIHSQKINYKNPVYLDDVLIFTAIVDEIHESVNTAIFKYQFDNQLKKTVAKGAVQIGVLV
jgi:acyl dehydratase